MKRSREGMSDSQVRDQVAGMVDATADVSDEANELLDDSDETSAQDDGDDQVSLFKGTATTESDKHLRLAAEFDNFRRRNLKEKMEAEARGQAELSRSILDSLDDIARFA